MQLFTHLITWLQKILNIEQVTASYNFKMDLIVTILKFQIDVSCCKLSLWWLLTSCVIKKVKYSVTAKLQQQSLLLWKYNVQCMECRIMVNIRDCTYTQKHKPHRLPGATGCWLRNTFYMHVRRDCRSRGQAKHDFVSWLR